MNYFEILNLGAEPFSNSPDPEFFYRSEIHGQCLHQLEIALRLKRGMSVVLGEVGLGKTTLCRELIRNLADDDNIAAHLLLDPYFSTQEEFLGVLHLMFCGVAAADGATPWQLKEGVKNALFRLAVDEDKLVVLIIDEGQKIDPGCLELLRELLNYETNDSKLLQIVIFAQTEFEPLMASFPNLADRVNDIIRLTPMDFRETRTMIRFRLDRAKKGFTPPELFTNRAYRAIHRHTGGYPRKVIKLCHKVALALIMQNKSRAGAATVNRCFREESGAPRSPWRRAVFPLAATAAALAVASVLLLPAGAPLRPLADKAANLIAGVGADPAPKQISGPEHIAQPELPTQTTQTAQTAPKDKPEPTALEPAGTRTTAAETDGISPVTEPKVKDATRAAVETAAVEKDAPGKESPPPGTAPETIPESAPEPTSEPAPKSIRDKAFAMGQPAFGNNSQPYFLESLHGVDAPIRALKPPPDAPAILGHVVVGSRDFLSGIMSEVYGLYRVRMQDEVLKTNPHLDNPNVLPKGSKLFLPAIPLADSRKATKAHWVRISREKSLTQARNRLHREGGRASGLHLLPYFRSHDGLHFDIMAIGPMDSKAQARAVLEALPERLRTKAETVPPLGEDTIFYSFIYSWGLVRSK